MATEGCNAQTVARKRPILFSAPMVRALLDGSKTQTRRAIKPQPRRVDGGVPFGDAPAWAHAEPGSAVMRCPYGKRGDRLWVRETWRVCGGREYEYQQDRSQAMYRATHQEDGFPLTWESYTWRPSIFMPRWASRITLQVTGVRVERLHGISRGDAMAEGCPFANMADGPDPRQWYAELWGQINGPDAWDANPWAWVVEFRRCPDLQPNVGAKAPT